jgi:hypothetical protein
MRIERRGRNRKRNARPIINRAELSTKAVAAGAAEAWAAVPGEAFTKPGGTAMSKALVKWRPAEVQPGNKMDTALARLRETEQAERWIPRSRPVLSPQAGEVLDLPRICAVHDKPYAARYIADADGRFRYAQTIRVTEALYLEQYADSVGQTRQLQGTELAEEFCP